MTGEYEPASWPQKFSRWWDFDLKEFVRAARLKLSLVEKDELLTFWSGYQKSCSELEAHLNAVDARIDALVYEIYGLDPAEIAIVESKIDNPVDVRALARLGGRADLVLRKFK